MNNDNAAFEYASDLALRTCIELADPFQTAPHDIDLATVGECLKLAHSFADFDVAGSLWDAATFMQEAG